MMIDDRVRGFHDGYHQRPMVWPNNKEYVRGWFEGAHLNRDELQAELLARLPPDLRAKARAWSDDFHNRLGRTPANLRLKGR
jgi:hypothetical protein